MMKIYFLNSIPCFIPLELRFGAKEIDPILGQKLRSREINLFLWDYRLVKTSSFLRIFPSWAYLALRSNSNIVSFIQILYDYLLFYQSRKSEVFLTEWLGVYYERIWTIELKINQLWDYIKRNFFYPLESMIQ